MLSVSSSHLNTSHVINTTAQHHEDAVQPTDPDTKSQGSPRTHKCSVTYAYNAHRMTEASLAKFTREEAGFKVYIVSYKSLTGCIEITESTAEKTSQ